MVKEDWGTGIVYAEFGDKGKAVDFDVGRKGSGKDSRRAGEPLAVGVVEIFCTQGKAEPFFGIEVEIESRAPPGAG